MDFVPTRGQVILDDAQLRLRTPGSVSRLTDLFAMKADQSTANAGFGERPAGAQVTAEITAAINALKGGAPQILNTRGEIADAPRW